MTKLQFLKIIIVTGIIASAGCVLFADIASASTSHPRSISLRLQAIRKTFEERANRNQESSKDDHEVETDSKKISQYYWPNWGNWPNWSNWRDWTNWGNWGNY